MYLCWATARTRAIRIGDFRLIRKFRGATYYIDVKKTDGVQKGVQKISVDGKELTGNLIPMEEGKTEYHVTVTMA